MTAPSQPNNAAHPNGAGAQVLTPLTTPEEVDTFLAQHPTAAVFKAGTCHKTMQGFGVIETFLQRYDLPIGFIRVVDWRPASNYVAEKTGIVHQSPQFILFQGAEAQYDVDNWDITPDTLAPVFQQYVPEREGTAQVGGGDLAPYMALIDGLLGGQLNEFEFQDRWVTFFRDDASLRSQREFELLSRLFGDPDAYHGGLHQLGGPADRGDLRARVEALRGELEALR